MNFRDFFNAGFGIKRWFGLGIVGISLIVFGIIELIFRRFYGVSYKLYYIYLLVLGISLLYVSINELLKSFMSLASGGFINFNMDSREI